MLVIRETQLNAFQESLDRQLASEIEAYLRTYHQALVANIAIERLAALVDAGIERCRAFGLTQLASICWFVVMLAEVGPYFDRHPTIHACLADRSIPPELRIQMLLDQITAEDWEAAKLMKAS